MIQSKNRIVVHDFMMGNGLQLKNLNLLLYAHIYSFWSSGREMYQSCSTIANLTGYTREAVNRTLKELEDAKLIVRLPLKGRYGNHYYTINEKTLNEILSARCDETAQVRCDEIAQGGVTKPHREVCENSTGTCDETAHNSIIDKETNEKEEKNTTEGSPLPPNCSNDKECVRLWKIIVTSSKWASRSEEALTEATKVLADQPVEVCRMMLAHTVEGDYPRIYEPTDEMKQKAKLTTPRCAEMSQLTVLSAKDDAMNKTIFGALHSHFPAELKDKIYCNQKLRFHVHDGKVTVSGLPEVCAWLNTIPDTLNPILEACVGPSYTGYSLYVYETK